MTMRVLVADDDKLFLEIASEMLTDAGHEVAIASNGPDAFELAKATRPDLIILDVILPGLLGTELSEQLKDHASTAAVPILLVSAQSSEVTNSGGPRAYRADDILPKPFTSEQLLERVNRLVRQCAS